MQAAPALHPHGRAVADWLEGLRCWVLDVPHPNSHRLKGQACDRLRPRFIAEALEQELQRQCGSAELLVHWQWESRTGQVSGMLLQGGQLQRFWWYPAMAQFRSEPLLQLRAQWWSQRGSSD